MDVDYCLTCDRHFEGGHFNPYCSPECRPETSHQHRQYYPTCSASFDDDDEDDYLEPIFHYVQDTSSIRRWASNIPHGQAPEEDHRPSSTRTKSPSPARSSLRRPKLLTSLSKRPASTTSSSYYHANPSSSTLESSTTDSSIATPNEPVSIQKESLIQFVKSWVSPPSSHSQRWKPTAPQKVPIISSTPPPPQSSSEYDDDSSENPWWIPQSTSQQCSSYISSTSALPIATKKSRNAYELTGFHNYSVAQPRVLHFTPR